LRRGLWHSLAILNIQQIIQPQELPNAVATQYETPASTVTAIRRIALFNSSGSDATFTVHIVPNASTVGNDNMFYKTVTLATLATTTLPELEGQILEAGDTIQMFASAANAITVIGSATEVS